MIYEQFFENLQSENFTIKISTYVTNKQHHLEEHFAILLEFRFKFNQEYLSRIQKHALAHQIPYYIRLTTYLKDTLQLVTLNLSKILSCAACFKMELNSDKSCQ